MRRTIINHFDPFDYKDFFWHHFPPLSSGVLQPILRQSGLLQLANIQGFIIRPFD